MPSKDKRVRVERGLYRTGTYFYACATPPRSRSAVWRTLGQVGLMEARRLRDKFAAEVQGTQIPVSRTRATFGELATEWLTDQAFAETVALFRRVLYGLTPPTVCPFSWSCWICGATAS